MSLRALDYSPSLGDYPHAPNPFRMNTCESVSKQRTLTSSRMNTYAKPRGGGGLIVNQIPQPGRISCDSHSCLPRETKGLFPLPSLAPSGPTLHSQATSNASGGA